METADTQQEKVMIRMTSVSISILVGFCIGYATRARRGRGQQRPLHAAPVHQQVSFARVRRAF